MKERCAGALLLALCLFALAGCGGNAKGTEYAVYYCNQAAGEEAALVAEKRVLPPDTEPVEGLLNLLLSPPQSENLTMAIPSGVTLRKWTLYNGLLTVDFSSGYGVLSGIDLTLADYSVVLTLTQLEGGGGDDYRRGRDAFLPGSPALDRGGGLVGAPVRYVGGNSPGCVLIFEETNYN